MTKAMYNAGWFEKWMSRYYARSYAGWASKGLEGSERLREIIMVKSFTFMFLLVVLASGCSTTMGQKIPNSQFAHPNSNITILGPTKAEFSKTTWVVSPNLAFKDIRGCYNKALSKVSGANILIDYKENTTYTKYPLMITTITYSIEGQAARMELGDQELR